MQVLVGIEFIEIRQKRAALDDLQTSEYSSQISGSALILNYQTWVIADLVIADIGENLIEAIDARDPLFF